MKKLQLLSFLAIYILATSAQGAQAALLVGADERGATLGDVSNAPWLMAYYVGYQNGYLKPRDVDYSLMTHIAVGGVRVESDGTLDEHWHLVNGDGRDMAEDVGRRAARAGVKTLIWLGGPHEEDNLYAASADAVRPTTVRNILTLVRELGYDGVDINWEPVRTQDEPRLLALVKDLRAASPDLLIAVPVNWVGTTIVTKKDLSMYAELATYADRLFVMSYSMAGPWPGWKSWHGGALRGDTLATPGSVRTSAFAYERAGVPKEKLGIGIGTYATCWEYPVRNPAQTIPKGFVPADVSVMSMRTFMDDYYVRKYERWDDKAKVPYLTFKKAKGDKQCGFISYENERSVTEKMRYVKSAGLGGAIVWNIGTGYFPDAPRSKRHPLLKAANDVIR